VNDLVIHLCLFGLISAVIVMMSAFFTETEDGAALKSFPRRLLHFLVGCGILTGLMLAVEATLASV
jgi:hypothetical protein